MIDKLQTQKTCLKCDNQEPYSFGLCYECWEANYLLALQCDALAAGDPVECPDCRGSGFQREVDEDGDFYGDYRDCDKCEGSGEVDSA